MQPGDTLWSIAASVDGDGDVRAVVDEIQRLNGLDGADLVPGQVLAAAVSDGDGWSDCSGAPRSRHVAPDARHGNSSTTSAADFVNPQYGRVHTLWSFDAYGRRVSGAMENRAAVFTSQPQAVEVYQAGAWWPGELLGWRHDADGSCQVWVRVVLGGVEESAWTDLTRLRLPERHLSVAPEPTARRGRVHHPEAAAGVIRGPSGASGPGPTPPRRRACPPSVTCPSSRPVRVPAVGAGRPRRPGAVTAPASPRSGAAGVAPRRAPSPSSPRLPPAPRSGGRRRAPELGEQAAPLNDAAASAAAAAGRHRAATGRRPRTSPEGRHGSVPRDQGLHPGAAFRDADPYRERGSTTPSAAVPVVRGQRSASCSRNC